jgi:multimeric flavodoxin WrbA
MTGCKGCYSCKNKTSLGKCVIQDDMSPLYQKIEKADAVIFGSPVYMCAMTPELKMVIDRLFPYLTFDLGSLLEKNIKTALIFTQNQENAALFESHINMTAFMIHTIGFEKPDILLSVNTIGYNERDLNSFAGDDTAAMHDKKMKYKSENWNRDLDAAYALGQKLAM